MTPFFARLQAIGGLLLLLSAGHAAAGDSTPAAIADLPPRPPDSAPPFPTAVTPVDRLRALLQLPAEKREAELAGRSESQREYLRARLKEFDALVPGERELRLEALTLRHYLLPLLRTDATNRVTGLQAVPRPYRDLVRARLVVWDQLGDAQQRAMLQSESIFAGLAYVPTPDGLAGSEQALDQLSTAKLERLQTDLTRWRSLAPEERHRITAQFKGFLTLTDEEQRKALAALELGRRTKATALVARFEQLTPEQRVKSIEAFARFSALPPTEQNRFLRNAARWRAMSADERSAWRRLLAHAPPVPQVPPPLPKGASLPTPPR